MFANLAIFCTALLASTASATVVLYSDQECKSTTTFSGTTEANKCWKTDSTSEWQSAVGCSNGHKLRLHQSTDCSDNLDDVDGNDVCQGNCASLNGLTIGSFKCVTDLTCSE